MREVQPEERRGGIRVRRSLTSCYDRAGTAMHELLETSETAAIRYAGVDRNTSALEEVWRLVVILWMKRPSTDDLHSAAESGGLPLVGLAILGSARAGFTAHSLAGKPCRFANLSATFWRGRDLGSVRQIAFSRGRPRNRLARRRPPVHAGGCAPCDHRACQLR